jgi:hypothetical protein
MATSSIGYSTTNTAITITLANLGNLAARASTYVDNSSTLYLDATLRVQCGIGTTTGSDNAVYIYGYGGQDTSYFGGNFTSGTDAAITTSGANFPLLGVMQTATFPPVTSTNYTYYVGSVANAFGGTLPKYWGVVILNSSGASLVNTAANHVVTYTGINATTA